MRLGRFFAIIAIGRIVFELIEHIGPGLWLALKHTWERIVEIWRQGQT